MSQNGQWDKFEGILLKWRRKKIYFSLDLRYKDDDSGEYFAIAFGGLTWEESQKSGKGTQKMGSKWFDYLLFFFN